MLNKIIIGVMAILLGWTIFSNLGGVVYKKEETQGESTPIESSEEGDQTGDSSTAEQPPIPKTGLEQGELTPDFTLQSMNGEDMKLSDLRGKKVILNFWASWCPPCRAEMPDMVKFYEQYAGEEVEILAVNLTESEKSMDNVEQFLDEFGVTFPVLLDETSEVAATYYAYSIPTTYFIDSTGTIQGKIIGPMNHDFMVKTIEQME